ncbi:hypothetical protein CCAX7_000220 [Capsulimonas corticalis]|uniref:Uncharacterized protein n=1 Tax=Capsulimonas corticalis TaxID=2219043 RepID=A0A402CRH3_9BACT|nr:hypothetical protein [Capsulimonas corticalis]BDI27971.1 hypothetical protein CCAX7_000220 [Capsulimonas corticalis]
MKINLWGWLKSLLNHNRTAIASVVTAAAVTAFQSAAAGKVNWPLVGVSVVTAVGAAAKSPVLSPTSQDPPAGSSEENANEGSGN